MSGPGQRSAVGGRYVLAARDQQEKDRWLNAFLEERANAEEAVFSGTSLVNNAVDEDEDERTRWPGLCSVSMVLVGFAHACPPLLPSPLPVQGRQLSTSAKR
jgi:hypothetical protein